MTQVEFGPFNINYGNSAFFTAEFFDAERNISVPASATLIVTYTNINKLAQVDIVTMSADNSFFTCTWSSTNASLGLANWSVVAGGVSSAAQQGIIRVIDSGT